MAWILLCKSCQFGDKMYYNYWDINFIIRDCFLLVHPVMWYFIASGKLLSLGLGSPIERRISSGDELHTNKWAKESQNCVKGNSPILYHNVCRSSIVDKFIFQFPYVDPFWSNDQMTNDDSTNEGTITFVWHDFGHLPISSKIWGAAKNPMAGY